MHCPTHSISSKSNPSLLIFLWIFLQAVLPFSSIAQTDLSKPQKSDVNYNASSDQTNSKAKTSSTNQADWKAECVEFLNSYTDSLRLPIPMLYNNTYIYGEELLRNKLTIVYKMQRDILADTEINQTDAIEKLKMSHGFTLNAAQYAMFENGQFDALIEYQKNPAFHILVDFPFNAPKRFKNQELEDFDNAVTIFRKDFYLYRYFYPDFFDRLPQGIKTKFDNNQFKELLVESVYAYKSYIENN